MNERPISDLDAKSSEALSAGDTGRFRWGDTMSFPIAASDCCMLGELVPELDVGGISTRAYLPVRSTLMISELLFT